mgnify:CR=1 FL=1
MAQKLGIMYKKLYRSTSFVGDKIKTRVFVTTDITYYIEQVILCKPKDVKEYGATKLRKYKDKVLCVRMVHLQNNVFNLMINDIVEFFEKVKNEVEN